MIKLIASDIDGTLLHDKKKGLDPKLFEQIKILKEHGIAFVAASGRQIASLEYLFAPVKEDISYIGENGSICIHNNQVISKSIIDEDLCNSIFEVLHNMPELHSVASGERLCYTTSKNERFLTELKHDMRNEVVCVDNFITDVKEPILKIAVCDYDDPEKTFSYFQDIFAGKIKVVTSGFAWIDFIAPDTNKGLALETLTKHLGISMADCVAFGDQYNDTEMLESVGTSYAMSNAAPGISYYATYVTDSVVDVLDDIIASITM